jgi:conjugal transfer pilus assembly protein TraB
MATPLTQRPSHPFSHALGNVLVQMRRNPVLAAVGIILLVLLFFLLLPGGQRSSRPAKGIVTVSPVTAKEYEAALVQRYEQQFHDLQTQMAAESKQRDAALDTVRGEVQQLSTSLQQELATLRQTLQPREPVRPEAMPQASVPTLRRIQPSNEKQRTAAPLPSREPARSQVMEIPAEDSVALPAGSWVSATLMTGVLAPADEAHPLPVLLRVNEAFTGPNQTRVPLQGCFALAKAAADLRAESATLQLETLSCTLPTGSVFEREVRGFATDGGTGDLGVRGTLVRKDTTALGMAALTGFLEGAGQALARAESTVTISPFTGTTTTTVNGNVAKYAGYAGLAKTANRLARHYLNIARYLTPAIHVPSNIDVHLVMLQGVTIEGLHADDLHATAVHYAAARQ